VTQARRTFARLQLLSEENISSEDLTFKIDDKIRNILDSPLSWGGKDALESLILCLLSLKDEMGSLKGLPPERSLLREYRSFIASEVGGGNGALKTRTSSLEEMVTVLEKFVLHLSPANTGLRTKMEKVALGLLEASAQDKDGEVWSWKRFTQEVVLNAKAVIFNELPSDYSIVSRGGLKFYQIGLLKPNEFFVIKEDPEFVGRMPVRDGEDFRAGFCIFNPGAIIKVEIK
jgi:hypothetical protein